MEYAEKSVLLYNEFYGKENNNSLAVCGSNFNKLQLGLLLKNFYLNEIIIAFDKEYSSYPTKESEKYFNKLMKICLKYKNYCNFSFIYDTKNLLKEKDSPVDKGKSTFEKLITDRVRVKNEI
jgi:DNA primase